MGGFFYAKKEQAEDLDMFERRHAASLACFRQKGMRCETKITRNDFSIFVFQKVRLDCENFLEFENGDFVVATGTPIYKRQIGTEALQSLYEDFDPDKLDFKEFLGHYGVLIQKGGRLVIFNDHTGVYQIHQNEDQSVLSNSFLAVVASLDTRTISRQELYEYLVMECTLDDQSMFTEIRSLERESLNQLWPVRKKFDKQLSLPEFSAATTFDSQIELFTDLFNDYFTTMRSLFGDRQSIGLSGGYDSRLLFAGMRHAGINPRVYVQGEPDSIDVRTAQNIAAGEGFDLDYRDDEADPKFSPLEFSDRVKTAFTYLDGIPQSGLFSNFGLVADEQRQHERYEVLRLYGIGGEAFRNFWHLPQDSYSPEDVIRAKLAKLNTSFYGEEFSREEFFAGLSDKMRADAAVTRENNEVLSWESIERSNLQWLVRHWVKGMMTNQNDRAYALLPYLEPVFVYGCASIPLRHKYLGKFQSKLMQSLDARLAGYQSAYGHSFDEKPRLRTRIIEHAVTYLPISTRKFARICARPFYNKPRLPFYLQNSFVKKIFPSGLRNLKRYVRLNSELPQRLLSRSMSMEILISGRNRFFDKWVSRKPELRGSGIRRIESAGLAIKK